jgi:hypothetical protein
MPANAMIWNLYRWTLVYGILLTLPAQHPVGSRMLRKGEAMGVQRRR